MFKYREKYMGWWMYKLQYLFCDEKKCERRIYYMKDKLTKKENRKRVCVCIASKVQHARTEEMAKRNPRSKYNSQKRCY